LLVNFFLEKLLVTFSLERKSNQKVQGQPDRSARLSGLPTVVPQCLLLIYDPLNYLGVLIVTVDLLSYSIAVVSFSCLSLFLLKENVTKKLCADLLVDVVSFEKRK
jgi:hypothetical protein